jgi:hypothetical protein
MHADEHLRKKALEVPPGSFRQAVVLAARRFKASWVELGKLLVKVRNEALYEDWGYPSFEAYALGELRIRKQTADKLTRSFSFLDRHEPQRMARLEAAEEAPPFEVVEVLAQAEERGQLTAQEYKSIRDAIWNPDKPPGELRRELVERFPPPKAPTSDLAALKRLWGLCRRLAAELHAHKQVPKAVAERAEALAEDLEALLAKKAEA